jgi:RHS repeat-associated protein
MFCWEIELSFKFISNRKLAPFALTTKRMLRQLAASVAAGSVWRCLAVAWLGLSSGLVSAQVPVNQFNYNREALFERDPITGFVTAEVLQPNHPQLCVRVEYGYDNYGNRRTISHRNCTGAIGSAVIETRTHTDDHLAEGLTPAGLVPTVVTNALDQIERRQIDIRYGGLTNVLGVNGLTSSAVYDDFGRKTLEVRTDGNRTAWAYQHCIGTATSNPACQSGNAAGAVVSYFVVVTPQNAAGAVNGPISTISFDTEGREVRRAFEAFAAGSIRSSVLVHQYDSLGRLTTQTGPYFDGDVAAEWVKWEHDELGRVIAEVRPNPNAAGGQARMSTDYNGRVITLTNALSQTLKKERDEFDRVFRVTDAQGNQISYQHDAFGNIAIVRDPASNVTNFVYDLRGRKVSVSDPNMGNWTYEVDVLGQLVKQTSPRALDSALTYDRLGRMTRRLESDLDSRWSYDKTTAGFTCGVGVGSLCEATTTTGYRRLNMYDLKGRLSQTATTLDSGTNAVFVSKASYDSNGRMDQQIWPTGLAITSIYDTQGLLVELRNSSGGALYWKRLENNARGQLVKALTGNGLTSVTQWQPETGLPMGLQAGTTGAPVSVVNQAYAYNALDNLTLRKDLILGLIEGFDYDRLNRLTSQSLIASNGNRNTVYWYNALGNITYNSDIGTFDYTPIAGTSGPLRPHAVRRITGQAGKLTNPTYAYDADGNIETVVGANGVTRTHRWTSFDMPQSLALSERGVSSVFLYGADHQRIRQVITRDGQARTILYLHPDNEGALYFERELQGTGGVATNRHFLSADKGPFLQIETPGGLMADPLPSSLVGMQMRYWHKDHLGSIAAVTDGSGGVLERLGYEPFGKRRQPTGEFDRTGAIDAITVKRGFTGHEHLDEVDYIHMNGRIYDPDISRFLSPDPTVPSVHHLQSFNRYSYARNNPLNRVDPSGFSDGGENGDGPSSDGAKGGDNESSETGRSLSNTNVKAAAGKGTAAGPADQDPKAPDNVAGDDNDRDSIKGYHSRQRKLSQDLIKGLETATEEVGWAVVTGPLARLGMWGLQAARRTFSLVEKSLLGSLSKVKGLFGKKASAEATEAEVKGALNATATEALGVEKQTITITGTRRPKGVTNPEIAKLETPNYPPGGANNFNQGIMKFGKTHNDTIARTSALTAEDVAEMQRKGLTPDLARAWAEKYANEAARNLNNPVAAARAALLQKTLGLMR